jgi:hypothetical protein
MGVGVDGNGNHVSFGNPTKLQFTDSQSLTIVSCFYLTVAAVSFPQILSKYTGTGSIPFWQWRLETGDKLAFYYGNIATAFGSVVGATAIAINTRVVGAARRDVAADTMAVFLNGVIDGTNTDASSGSYTISTGDVASEFTGSGTNGISALKVFDFIFDIALSDAEIAEISNNPYSMLEHGFWPSDQMQSVWSKLPNIPVALELGMPYDSSTNLRSYSFTPYESVRSVLAATKIPYESLRGVRGTTGMPYESDGVPFNTLYLYWNVINTELVNVPLVLLWDVIALPGQIPPLTLQWNVRNTPVPLTLRWRVMGTLPTLWESDIQKPVAEIEEI